LLLLLAKKMLTSKDTRPMIPRAMLKPIAVRAPVESFPKFMIDGFGIVDDVEDAMTLATVA
jgi:hypothetical protein